MMEVEGRGTERAGRRASEGLSRLTQLTGGVGETMHGLGKRSLAIRTVSLLVIRQRLPD